MKPPPQFAASVNGAGLNRRPGVCHLNPGADNKRGTRGKPFGLGSAGVKDTNGAFFGAFLKRKPRKLAGEETGCGVGPAGENTEEERKCLENSHISK